MDRRAGRGDGHRPAQAGDSKTIDLGAATGLQVVFNNGTGTWDNNSGANYTLGTGDVTVTGGVAGTGDPCAAGRPPPRRRPPATPPPSSTPPPASLVGVNIHYRADRRAWTAVPGVAMNETACAGWVKKTVDLGAATGRRPRSTTAGTWDNNNGANYPSPPAVSRVAGGIVTAAPTDPCAAGPARHHAPTVPGELTATVDRITVTLAWTASTDDRGVTGYQVTRTGGTRSSSPRGTTVHRQRPRAATSYT